MEQLTPQTMKLLGSTKSKIKNMLKICLIQKIFKVVLIHYNVVNNTYQWNSRDLYTFVTIKSLLDISPKHFTSL